MTLGICSCWNQISIPNLTTWNCGLRVLMRCVIHRLSSGTSLMHHSPTVMKSVFLILLTRHTFVGLIMDTCMMMATTYLSHSLQTTRMHSSLTQSSSLLMQHVLGSYICLALPRPSTSWSAMSKNGGPCL